MGGGREGEGRKGGGDDSSNTPFSASLEGVEEMIMGREMRP